MNYFPSDLILPVRPLTTYLSLTRAVKGYNRRRITGNNGTTSLP